MTGGRHALAWLVGGVIALIVALAIALALILAFLKFDQRLFEITGNRLELVLEEVRRQTETGLALGLELAELEGLSAVLERAAKARDVERIDIWDTRGRILFSTQLDSVGKDDGASAAGYPDGPGPHRHRLSNKLLLSLPLTNGFGQLVGSVGVSAYLGGLHQALLSVRNELLATATPVVAIALLLTFLTVVLTLWFSAGLMRPSNKEARGNASGAPPQPSPHPGRLRAIFTRVFPSHNPATPRQRTSMDNWR